VNAPTSSPTARQSSAQRSPSSNSNPFSEADVLCAVLQLTGSGRGRSVLRDLLEFLDGDSLALDASNQRAVVTLLMSCWNGLPMMTRDCIRGAIAHGEVVIAGPAERVDRPVPMT